MNKETQISRLGFGTLRLPTKEISGKKGADLEEIERMVREACLQGITYFDCAPTYCAWQCEQAVGHALKPFRKQILLASKVPLDALKKSGDLQKLLEQSLERLDTDYLDYYYFWGINKKDFEKTALENGFLEEMEMLRQSGQIRHIGFSFHDEAEYAIDVLQMASERGIPFDAMLCQYNLLDCRMEKILFLAKEKYRVKNLVMGAAAGGKLDFRAAYFHVWNHPAVDCLLSGMQSIEMVKENVKLFHEYCSLDSDEKESVKDIIRLEKRRKAGLLEFYCTGCGYCMPCPAGVNIPDYLRSLQQIYFHQDAEEYHKYIQKYGNPKKQCRMCGLCEQKCPQGVSIRGYIKNNHGGALWNI